MKAKESESDGDGLAKVPRPGFFTRIESGREGCLAHASDLLRGARAIQEQDLPNIAYHLVTLALEEIGTAKLIGLEAMGRTREETPSWTAKHALDHTKKIFWSFFGAHVREK
ncbi:MAG: AbiV family abortive infection protein [Gammaproteobacteria bacterium]